MGHMIWPISYAAYDMLKKYLPYGIKNLLNPFQWFQYREIKLLL